MQSVGSFITLEGVEGAGKSVQINRLAERIRAAGRSVAVSREPGGTAFGRELRRLLLDPEAPRPVAPAELLLYLADRCQHLEEIIRPALTRGNWVVCDRYHDATLAYQGHARGLGIEAIDQLARSLHILEPDLTLVLDIDPEVSLKRARERNQGEGGHEGRFEAESLEFHRRVREGYHLLQRRSPARMVLVDASGSIEEVAARIWEHVQRRLHHAV